MIRKTIKERNKLRRYIIMSAILILFIAGGYRAFTLYKTYKSYNQEIQSILSAADENKHNILKAILTEAHDVIEYKTRLDTATLHRSMIESMDRDQIYDNIVNMNLDNEFIKILDSTFNLSEKNDDIILMIGTKDYVFYSKSNVDLNKYKYIETSGREYLTWEEYFDKISDKEVMGKAFDDLVMNKVDYVILRSDGYYPEGRYYTIEDVIQDYHNNGYKNMDKYYIMTLGLITDNGDIFGEPDNIYLNKNEFVNKIYVFKSVSIDSFLSNYQPLIDSLDQSISVKVIKYRNTTEIGHALIDILLITTSIIILMVVIKSLEDENQELDKMDEKPK